ncbi:MAG: S24/S26 family peptidase [Pseudomonadota bacterium]
MRPRLVRVRGNSMQPSFNDGDVCLAVPLPRRFLGSGTVVLLDHPALGLLIKRVDTHGANGVTVRGDNPRHDVGVQLGTLPWPQIVGRVVWSWSKQRR